MRTPAEDLFERIVALPNLLQAVRKAIRGKRAVPGAAAFMANLERELIAIQDALRAGTWRGGGYRAFTVRDPKPRRVSAAPFRDRVVHHALCAVVAPIFERGFTADSFANRIGMGTHRAVLRYERYRDRFDFVLRCDIYRYFPSIDHVVLKADLRRRIACPRTLALLDTIIDGSNPQEPVEVYFPGDDLFEPHRRRRGLPIGNLTSQFFANVYLDRMDHWVREVLRMPGYVRYVDDFALFHDDPGVLREARVRLQGFLDRRRLLLHPAKTALQPTWEPARFLGYWLAPGGLRRLPEENVRRFRSRLQGMRDRWRAGTLSTDGARCRIGSWIAHARFADTWRLRRQLFRGGMFDPALKV